MRQVILCTEKVSTLDVIARFQIQRSFVSIVSTGKITGLRADRLILICSVDVLPL